jgi:hypothetical protein
MQARKDKKSLIRNYKNGGLNTVKVPGDWALHALKSDELPYAITHIFSAKKKGVLEKLSISESLTECGVVDNWSAGKECFQRYKLGAGMCGAGRTGKGARRSSGLLITNAVLISATVDVLAYALSPDCRIRSLPMDRKGFKFMNMGASSYFNLIDASLRARDPSLTCWNRHFDMSRQWFAGPKAYILFASEPGPTHYRD